MPARPWSTLNYDGGRLGLAVLNTRTSDCVKVLLAERGRNFHRNSVLSIKHGTCLELRFRTRAINGLLSPLDAHTAAPKTATLASSVRVAAGQSHYGISAAILRPTDYTSG